MFELTFTDAVVPARFSGTLAADWDLTVVGGEVHHRYRRGGGPHRAGLHVRLERRAGAIAVRLTDGAPEAVKLAGAAAAFFDEVVAVELGVDGTGGLTVRVAGAATPAGWS